MGLVDRCLIEWVHSFNIAMGCRVVGCSDAGNGGHGVVDE